MNLSNEYDLGFNQKSAQQLKAREEPWSRGLPSNEFIDPWNLKKSSRLDAATSFVKQKSDWKT